MEQRSPSACLPPSHPCRHAPCWPSQVPQLRLICGDILRQDLPALLAGMREHAGQANGNGAAAAAADAAGQQQQQQQPDGGTANAPSQQQAGAAAPLRAEQQGAQQPRAAAAGQLPIKVVANLPYYITKDLLVKMLPLGGAVSALYLMLQARRGAAEHALPAPGRLGSCRLARSRAAACSITGLGR